MMPDTEVTSNSETPTTTSAPTTVAAPETLLQRAEHTIEEVEQAIEDVAEKVETFIEEKFGDDADSSDTAEAATEVASTTDQNAPKA